jgi:hypothetical protein
LVGEALVEGGLVRPVATGGMVGLGLETWPDLDGGSEEGAAFADGLEAAVELGWSGAPAVAEHAVVLGSHASHGRPFGIAAEADGGLVVEGFDFGGDGVVFVGDVGVLT